MSKFIKIITVFFSAAAVIFNCTVGLADYSAAVLNGGRPGEVSQQGERVTVKALQNGDLMTLAEIDEMNATLNELENSDEIIELIRTGLRNRDSEIYLSDYNIMYTDAAACYQYVMNNSPELFYVSVYYYYNIWEDGTIDFFTPQYTMDEAEIAEAQLLIDEEAANVCAEIEPGMSRSDMIVAVHNYFKANYTYDWEHYSDSSYERKFNIMSLFVDKTSVCQGFTLGMQYILEQYDVPCMTVQSDAMGHIWNLFQAREGVDNWYHVDCTWDNTGNSNDFLFVSDSKIQSIYWNTDVHHDYTPDDMANDDYYDDMPIKNAYGDIGYIDGYWYYFSTDSSENGTSYGVLYRYSTTTGTTEEVLTVESGTWTVPYYYEGSWVIAKYPDMAQCVVYNGIVYYNTARDIWAYDPATGESSLVASEVEGTEKDAKNIYALSLSGNTLVYSVGENPDGNYTDYTMVLPSGENKIELSDTSAEITLSGVSGASRLYTAYYDADGRFLGAHSTEHDGSVDISFTDTLISGWDEIRAFAWDYSDESKPEPVGKAISTK